MAFAATNGVKEAAGRLRHELSVIEEMGYASYFLIVWDVIQSSTIPVHSSVFIGVLAILMNDTRFTSVSGMSIRTCPLATVTLSGTGAR